MPTPDSLNACITVVRFRPSGNWSRAYGPMYQVRDVSGLRLEREDHREGEQMATCVYAWRNARPQLASRSKLGVCTTPSSLNAPASSVRRSST